MSAPERPEPPAAEEPSYASVRRKLVERGYLHGRIERFVLDDLLHEPTPARRARTALKAAIIGGPLLGALLAGAAATTARPLLGATDLPLLWFYFAVLSGAALFLLDLLAAAAVTALARRRGVRSTDALRASAIVGGPTLVYLWLVWLAHRPGASLAGDALFLAAAVAATLLVAWLAGLVSLVDVIGSTGQVPDRIRRPLLVALLALAALAAGLVAMRVGSTHDGIAAAPFEPRPVATDLLFVGIDGLDRDAVETLGREGMPALHAGYDAGALFSFSRPDGIEPPEAWTTLLTGFPVEEHRVRSAGSERLPGVATPLGAAAGSPLGAAVRFLLPTRTVPASGVGRQARNLPEVLGLRRPSASIGWWATWPASVPEAGGFVVSDRVLPKLLAAALPDRDTGPGSLFHRLSGDFAASRAALRTAFDARFGELATGEAGRLLWESYLIDAWSWQLGRRLAASQVRSTFVYLPGFDILRHRLTLDGVATADGEAARTRYLGWLDELIGELLPAPEGVAVVLVGERGRRGTGPGWLLVTEATDPAGAPSGCDGGAIDPLDVAPLVLGLRGFPGSAEMPGSFPGNCLTPIESLPDIAGYGRRPVYRGPAGSAFDAEMVERLRSLGYLN